MRLRQRLNPLAANRHRLGGNRVNAQAVTSSGNKTW